MSITRALLCVAALLSLPAVAMADPDGEDELAALSQLIERSPGNVELLIRRADLRLREAELDEAAADLRLVEGLAPDEPRLLLLRGWIEFERGRFGSAEASLESYVARTGGSFRSWFLLGRIQERLDRPHAALTSYDAAMGFGDEPDLYLARGRVLEVLDRLEDAAANYAAGLHATNGSVVMRVRLIEVERRLGRFDSALAHVETAMRRARVKTVWLLRRGEILEAAGRHAEARRARLDALAEAERLLSRRRSPAALAARGEALLALGRIEEAERDLAQALRRAPRMPDARAALAEARRLLGGAR